MMLLFRCGKVFCGEVNFVGIDVSKSVSEKGQGEYWEVH